MRYDFDGYGWMYIDDGAGSSWQTRHLNAEPLYTAEALDEARAEERARNVALLLAMTQKFKRLGYVDGEMDETLMIGAAAISAAAEEIDAQGATEPKDARSASEGAPGGSEAELASGGAFAGDFRK